MWNTPFSSGGPVARRLAKLALSVALTGAVVIGLGAQQAPPVAPPAQTPAATPAPAPQRSPDQLAMAAAAAVKDPAERLAALEKVRTDFPTSTVTATLDSQILATVAAMP